jgi:hypothetical protein
LVLIALPVAAAFAQQFEPFDATERQASAKAAQWMQSPGYREKAWGAYLAGKYRLQDQAASLVSQLVALRGLAGDTLHVDSPEFGAIQATLDALIQLGHPVDAASLLPFRKQWANEVLILLAEDPQANREALLAMAEQRDPADTRWVAIHNLLVGARSAGMAARLLAGVNVIHVFYVMDRAGYPAGSGGGGGGAIYDGLPGFAPGFPHAGVYDLFLSRQADGVLFAPGTHPVYYRRATTARCRTFPEIDSPGVWVGVSCRTGPSSAPRNQTGADAQHGNPMGRCQGIQAAGEYCCSRATSRDPTTLERPEKRRGAHARGGRGVEAEDFHRSGRSA